MLSHLLQVGLDEGQFALHEDYNTRMIKKALLLGQRAQQVVDVHGVLLHVERNCLVEVLGVGALEEKLLELHMYIVTSRELIFICQKYMTNFRRSSLSLT
jgi:hypothetical protein